MVRNRARRAFIASFIKYLEFNRANIGEGKTELNFLNSGIRIDLDAFKYKSIDFVIEYLKNQLNNSEKKRKKSVF